MKYFILAFLLMGAFVTNGQSVVPLRGDTIKIYKAGGYAELVVQNRTKDSLGVMINTGNGKTEFRRAKKIDDAHIVVGLDTLEVGTSSAGNQTLSTVTFFGNGTPYSLRIVDGVDTTIEYGSFFYNGDFQGEIDLGTGLGAITKYQMDSIVHRDSVLRYPNKSGTFALLSDLTGSGSNMANADLTADGDHTVNYAQHVWQLNNGSFFAIRANAATTTDSNARIAIDASPGTNPSISLTATNDDGANYGRVTVGPAVGAYMQASDGTHTTKIEAMPNGTVRINPTGTAGHSVGEILKLADPGTGEVEYSPDVVDTTIIRIVSAATGFDPFYRTTVGGNDKLSFPKFRDSLDLHIVKPADSALVFYVDLSGKQNVLSGTGYLKQSGTTSSYLTPTQVTADLNVFSSTLKGLAPLSGGGTTNFLRADGTWAAPGSSQTLPQVLATGRTLANDDSVLLATHQLAITGGLTRLDSLRFGVVAAPMAKIGTLNGLGDSFRNPATGSTAPNDSSELAMLADTLHVGYNNLALSGSGVRYAIQVMDSVINGPFNTAITWVQSGYNDARASGNNSRTPLKVVSALVAGLINHFAEEYVTGSDTTTAFIHRYGTWTTALNSTTMGGKTKNGAQTSTLNDSITYDFIGRYAGVVLKGGDGSAVITSIVRVNIDGGSTTDYNTTVADGTTVVGNVNTSIPYGIVLDAGFYGRHHVKIVNTEAKIMYVDYFAPLTPGVRGPYIVNHCIYPVAPTGTQYLAVNNAIDSTWATLPTTIFPTWVVAVNTVFDRTTGLSGDAIHPNNTGYKQILRAEMIQWFNRANSLQGVVIGDSTGLYYYYKGYRRLVEASEVFTRSEAAYNFTSWVGVPANASYKVGGIDIWKADVTNKNYLIGNAAGTAITSGTGNLFAGDLAGTTCTTCANNMALGTAAMQLSTTSSANAAVGAFALQQNTTGGSNTAVGFGALKATATASNNTGIGQSALILNTASNNTAIGSSVAGSNTTGASNTWIGFQSGNANVSSNFNSGFGYQSLFSSTGASNTADGAFAQAFQTSGTGNASVGLQSLYGNGTAGAFNYSTAIGFSAGKLNGAGGDFNVYIGDSAGVTPTATTVSGKRNIVLGNADTLLSPTSNDYMNLGHVIFGDRATQRVSIKANSFINSYLALPASTTSYSSLNIPAGTAPTSPLHGDVWTDANHLYGRLNGVTYQLDQQSGSGVTTVGSFSGSSQANGASISSSTITFGPADVSNPGMVSTGTQTIAGAKTFNSTVVGNSLGIFYHYISGAAPPSLGGSSGAGSGSVLSATGSDQDGMLTITTGTSCAANSTIVTATYTLPFATNSYPTLTPANAVTAALSGTTMVFTTGTTTTFTITSGSSALTDATVYKWYYHVGGN